MENLAKDRKFSLFSFSFLFFLFSSFFVCFIFPSFCFVISSFFLLVYCFLFPCLFFILLLLLFFLVTFLFFFLVYFFSLYSLLLLYWKFHIFAGKKVQKNVPDWRPWKWNTLLFTKFNTWGIVKNFVKNGHWAVILCRFQISRKMLKF